MPIASLQPYAARGVFLALALMPLLAVYSPIGMTPLAVALALLAAAWAKDAPLFPMARGFWFGAAGLLLWGVVTLCWSIEPQATLVHAAKLSGMLAVAWAVHRMLPASPAPLRLLVTGFALGLGAIWLAHLTQGVTMGKDPLYWKDHRLNRSVCILAVLMWPLVGLLWRRLAPGRRTIACGTLLVATAATVLPMESQSATLGLLAGVGVAAVTAWKPGFARLLAWAAPLFLAAMLAGFTQLRAEPLANSALAGFPQSALHRLYIWEFATSRAVEQPVLGWGLGSSRYLPGGQGVVYPDKILMPLHPHNSVLQIWVELGLPGVAAFMAALWFLFRQISTLAQPWAACGAGLLTTHVIIGLTGYGVWQEWWIATGVLCSAALTLFMREEQRTG
ncbi:MAG: O-antigen ligase family protein [Alphaproteobacteria bacterium]|nr:O-antigen ligase family protein [Alphaproteobacteria bacterium]